LEHESNSPAASKQLAPISTALTANEVNARLLKLSKGGKLPGYEGNPDHALAAVAAHGTPFDSKLYIHHDSGQLSFEIKLMQTMPIVFLVVIIVSIWPGLPLTDAFLNSFLWYERFQSNTGVQTWYWYLPLTVLPAPFMWKSAIAKSKASAKESAAEAIEKISKAIS